MIPKHPSELKTLELLSMVAANEEAFAPQARRDPSGVVTDRTRPFGWDPFEVWRTRVKAARDERTTPVIR
ncbi:MAG TPA: hypothetical protein P5528_14655 [Steroidobacteraceae bacterium]|nr:hypothetical protein [Steroidobacteraceae bacterium]HRX90677.1 hypothetical protein [Steroidobacteraceae bacterium]